MRRLRGPAKPTQIQVPVLTATEPVGLPALTAAAVVCRSRSRLEQQTGLISSFLDCVCDHWTLESVLSDAAAELNEPSPVRLLDRLLAHEWSQLSTEFRTNRFLHNVKRAGQQNKMRILDWWLTKYLPVNEATAKSIMQCAIDWDRVRVLVRLEQERRLPDPKGVVLECRYADTTYWLHERGYSLSIDVETEIARNNFEFMNWVDSHKEHHILRELERGIVAVACTSYVAMAQWLIETFAETEWDEQEEHEDHNWLIWKWPSG